VIVWLARIDARAAARPCVDQSNGTGIPNPGALRGRPRYDGNADTLLASLGLIQKTAGTILAAIARAETNAAEDTRPMMN
jgi:hypothetical protein